MKRILIILIIVQSCPNYFTFLHVFLIYSSIYSISELRSLISISVHVQHLHEVVDSVVWVAANLLHNLAHAENARELLVGDEVDLVSEVLLQDLLQGLLCLRERYKSGFAVVVGVSANLLEGLYEQLAASCKALPDLSCLQSVLPVGQSCRLDRYFRTDREDATEGFVPFPLIDDLVVSRINGVEHVFDDRVAGHWRLGELAELSDEGIEVQVCHAALPRGVELRK